MLGQARSSSPEAQALLARMEELGHADVNVAAIRENLTKYFTRRIDRAKERYQPNLSRQEFDGVPCLVITPEIVTSDATVLYFFGGGYVSGAPEFELPIAAHLAARCGVRLVLPDYPLAPEYPFPAALVTARSVHASLRAENAGQLILSGESAGGNLALSLLRDLRVNNAPDPAGLCLFSPWIDLTETGHASTAQIADPTLNQQHLQLCARTVCSGANPSTLSPPQFTAPLPPTFISTGTRDIMWPMIEAFAAAHDNTPELHVWPCLWHVFEFYDEIPEAAQSLDQASEFILSILS